MDFHRQLSDALTSFYELIISIPCLEDFTIATPPEEGWSVGNPMGKDDSVIDLLRHIPYLRRVHPSSVSLLPIYPGVIPIDYPEEGWDPERMHFYPLPSHCVYLAQRDDSQGTDLILDASSGAVTEFSSNNRITVPYEEYEMLPEAERWRVHPTSPLPELLDRWAQMYRQLNLLVSPNPIKRPCAVNFRFHEKPTVTNVTAMENEVSSEPDRELSDAIRRQRELAEVRTMSCPWLFSCFVCRLKKRALWKVN